MPWPSGQELPTAPPPTQWRETDSRRAGLLPVGVSGSGELLMGVIVAIGAGHIDSCADGAPPGTLTSRSRQVSPELDLR